MRTRISDLTTAQLKNILALKEQIQSLQGQMDSIASAGGNGAGRMPSLFVEGAPKKRRRRMSRAGRAAIADAARARWAKVRGTGAKSPKPAKKKDGRSSPAVRGKLAAAAKARWAKVRVEGKKTL
jgi:hypothetical protein